MEGKERTKKKELKIITAKVNKQLIPHSLHRSLLLVSGSVAGKLSS